jgi:hypothetical protein
MLRDEVLRAIFHIHKHEVQAKEVTDDEYETDLTRAARSAVETGVNEIGAPEKHGDSEFKTVKKIKSAAVVSKKKKDAKKKRKTARASRKHK